MENQKVNEFVEIFFQKLDAQSKDFLQEKRIKYSYDFENDLPLANTRIRKIILKKPNQSKEKILKYNIDHVDFSFDSKTDFDIFKKEARRISSPCRLNERASKKHENLLIDSTNQLNSKF